MSKPEGMLADWTEATAELIWPQHPSECSSDGGQPR